MTQKPLKMTIRRHDRAYLERLAAQMELPPHAALSWILTDLRLKGYSFNAQMQFSPQGLSYNPSVASNLEFSLPTPMEEIQSDPVINHLLSVGLEQF